MAAGSAIEWTEATWNPLTGCTKVSAGCKHCYAERMSKRLHGMGVRSYRNGFSLTLHEELLEMPLSWKKPKKIFVNSMSDLFHEAVPFDFIEKVFQTMEQAHWHQFQVLTKRPARAANLSPFLPWPANVWMGTSIENERYLSRADSIRQIDASVRFLSLEPLLGPLPNLDLEGIDWVIVGGESGPGARMITEAWVVEIRENCQRSGVPFFFKQWGGVWKKKAGRSLEGKTWDQMPQIPSTPRA